MPAADDLKTHALSSTDFYELLALDPAADQKGLDRAWRRTALKYHPDKVAPADAEAAREKFHLASIGYEILSDASLRALYDRTRAARALRERQRQQLQEGRRAAREDLEARERSSHAAKRSAGEAFDSAAPVSLSSRTADEEQLERELRRLADDGRRRREALQEKLRQREQEAMRSATPEEATRKVVEDQVRDRVPSPPQSALATASELDRTVKAQFARADTADVGMEAFEAVFRDAFGDVEYVFEREGKKKRKKKKRKHRSEDATADADADANADADADDAAPPPYRTIVVTFTSLLGAHGAVEKWQREREREQSNPKIWSACADIQWAGGKEPAAVSAWGHGGNMPVQGKEVRPDRDAKNNVATNGQQHSTNPPPSASSSNGAGATGVESTAARLARLRAGLGNDAAAARNGDEELKGAKRSFGSFAGSSASSVAGRSTPSQNPFVGVGGAPSLEELTLMRLRHAEKRKAEAAKLVAEEQQEHQG